MAVPVQKGLFILWVSSRSYQPIAPLLRGALSLSLQFETHGCFSAALAAGARDQSVARRRGGHRCAHGTGTR